MHATRQILAFVISNEIHGSFGGLGITDVTPVHRPIVMLRVSQQTRLQDLQREQLHHAPVLVDLADGDVGEVGGEALLQPSDAPEVGRDEIAEPGVRVLVGEGHQIAVNASEWRDAGQHQRHGLAKGDETPVLHGAEIKVRHGEVLDFAHGIRQGHPGLESRVNLGAVHEHRAGSQRLERVLEPRPQPHPRVRGGVYSAETVDRPAQEVRRHPGRPRKLCDVVIRPIAMCACVKSKGVKDRFDCFLFLLYTCFECDSILMRESIVVFRMNF